MYSFIALWGWNASTLSGFWRVNGVTTTIHFGLA